MAEIVKGLFGIDPQAYQQNQMETQQAAAMQFARLNPAQQAQYGAFRGGQQLANAGANLMGVQDPELQAQQIASQLSGQFDLSTAEGMTAYSKALGQKSQETGLPALSNFASMAGQKALSMKATTTDIGYKQALTETATTKLDVERKARDAISALGPDATEEEVLAAVRPFGDPDTVIKALSASQDKQAALAQRQAVIDTKAYEKAKSSEEKVKVVTDNADRMINVIQQSIPMVGYNTAGLAGKATIWGSEGADLQKNLDTVKANLGFDRLQQMRDASKTGGALGSVAVKELEALQSTVSSLDRTQSPEKLRESLQNIEYYYTRWRKAVNGEDPGPAVREKGATGSTSAPASKGQAGTKENPIKLD
jgi:hypothetical protein